MLELYGQLVAEHQHGIAGSGCHVGFERVEGGPDLSVLAQHDQDGCREASTAQEREQELLFEVDVSAQLSDRGAQWRGIAISWSGTRSKRLDSVVDLVVFPLQRVRERFDFHLYHLRSRAVAEAVRPVTSASLSRLNTTTLVKKEGQHKPQ